MNIQQLYNILSEEEKEELITLLQIKVNNKTPITKFLNKHQMSERLYNVLLNSGYNFVEDIPLKYFHHQRNAGKKTKEELTQILQDNGYLD